MYIIAIDVYILFMVAMVLEYINLEMFLDVCAKFEEYCVARISCNELHYFLKIEFITISTIC